MTELRREIGECVKKLKEAHGGDIIPINVHKTGMRPRFSGKVLYPPKLDLDEISRRLTMEDNGAPNE